MRTRALGALAILTASSCGSHAPPASGAEIAFVEVTDGRAPSLAQTRYVPNDGFNSGLGAAVGDVDGDGRPDVYLAGGGLYLNRPDPLGFRLSAAPLQTPPPDFALIGAAFGDYDRDGDLDLALAGQHGVKLWANDGGMFHDVTATAGVAGSTDDLSVSVAWGDIDGDGFLDLAVANYGFSGTANDAQPSRLYLNRRDGTFAEVLAPVHDHHVRAWVTAFADFDGDGRVDFYVGDDADIPFIDPSKPRHDRVFLNRGLDAAGKLVLVESSEDLGLKTPHATMGCAIGNASRGPGWDALIADIRASWLYRTDGTGPRFQDVTAASNIDLAGPKEDAWVQWGSAFVDLDGDGFEDALVGQSPILPGQSDVPSPIGPPLLRNRGGHFDLVRYAFGGPMNARAIVLVDLDVDGDVDAIVAPFFDRFRVFTNTSRARHFVRVKLAATVSAPGAAGAVIVAKSGDVVQKRMQVAGGQPHSTSEDIVDFGLGDAVAADMTVTWPSGAVQKVPGAASGAVLTITEPRWITLSDARPPADGTTHVSATLNATAAGLGGPGTRVHWTSPGVSLDAVCDGNGVATFDIPPRSVVGPIQGVVSVDGRELPAHPALDYR